MRGARGRDQNRGAWEKRLFKAKDENEHEQQKERDKNRRTGKKKTMKH